MNYLEIVSVVIVILFAIPAVVVAVNIVCAKWKPKMSFVEFWNKYKYKTDLEQYDTLEDWRIPEELNDEVIDDCDGCFLFLKYRVKNYENLKGHFAVNKTTGVGHVIGELNGSYIDNNTRALVSEVAKYQLVRRIYPIEIWYRMFLTKIGFFKLFTKLKGK